MSISQVDHMSVRESHVGSIRSTERSFLTSIRRRLIVVEKRCAHGPPTRCGTFVTPIGNGDTNPSEQIDSLSKRVRVEIVAVSRAGQWSLAADERRTT